MASKEQQRVEMRARILDSAIVAYAELGYIGASTRDIASRAGISQGLLTYHFKNKNELWFATVDRLFENFTKHIGSEPFTGPESDSHQRLLKFMTYISKKPHVLKFIIDSGKEWNERSEYLVNNHVKPMFERFSKRLPKHLSGDMAPHVFYAWLGACTTIFSVPAECEHVTGVDPTTPEAIAKHTELIAQLFLVDETKSG